VLVIGYGNALRGDDGLGPHVAGAVAAWGWPGVRVRTVIQLVPELAADLAGARLAVFVDARDGTAGAGVEPICLSAGDRADWTTHAADPRGLLALTWALYGRAPEAWWVTAPGEDFGFREGLSQFGEQGARAALQRVETILREWVVGS
jgi:hydrogenase maturation protease